MKAVLRNQMAFQHCPRRKMEKTILIAKQQWIKSEPLEGSSVFSMFSTDDGELYVMGGPNPSIFKLSEDGSSWQHLFDIINLNTGFGGNAPIAKWKEHTLLGPRRTLCFNR